MQRIATHWILKGFILLHALCVDDAGAESVVVGHFDQEVARAFGPENGLPPGPVDQVQIIQSLVLSLIGGAWYQWDGKDAWLPLKAQIPAIEPLNLPDSLAVQLSGKINQSIKLRSKDRWIAATSAGLFMQATQEPQLMEPMVIHDADGRQWGTQDVRCVAEDHKGEIWFGCKAGVGHLSQQGWHFYEGKDGLPYNDFLSIGVGPDGEIWFGTTMGLIRFHEGKWAYRQGKRWLPNDEVRSLTVDGQGRLWAGTGSGIGLIESIPMTLEEKAQHYEQEIELYIKRTPFGYVSEVSMIQPGSREEIVRHDSDNDGLWTSMYGAGECFAYAATKDPDAARRARQAFHALAFLQDVASGGNHPAPKGFVARTIRSTQLPNPNDGRLASDYQIKETQDYLWKTYEPRWPRSEDGQWFWKSDTSSDELDGHYFFYPLFYDLVANAAEKERVRQIVRDLTDHLIDHDFQLVDHTGSVTRWGTYRPEDLNHNPDWWAERGLKSLSMLAYLAVAAHITEDSRYLEIQTRLIEDHAYDQNAMIYKIHRGPGSGNQSDDEMAFMCYYTLLRYTPDGPLKQKILTSFYAAWLNEQAERNPFFNFCYAAHALNKKVTDPWGPHAISPADNWLDDALATLKGFSLDRANWSSLNSHRLDIQTLGETSRIDLFDADSSPRGYLNNGMVLPVENTHFNHWNTDPWRLDYHGNGTTLASGTVFLLPYYMGIYHQWIR